MRRLLVLLTLLMLTVAGCGGAGSGGGLASIKVSGAPGVKPKISLDTPFSTATTERKVLKEGTGAVVKVGEKVSVNYLGINGKDGKEFDSSFDPKKPTDFTLAEGSLIKGFVTALTGVKVGSRVLVAIAPKDGYGPAGGQPSAGIGKDDTLVFVIDVLRARTVLSHAEGDPVPQVAGNPSVAVDAAGVPTITVPKGPPPSQLVISPLIVGKGDKIAGGAKITVNYLVVRWSDSMVMESSWAKGSPAPLVVGAGQLLPDLDAGLVNQTVGSRVLLVVPQPDGVAAEPQPNPESPSAAPSAAPTAPVKPDALVFVIDILDAS